MSILKYLILMLSLFSPFCFGFDFHLLSLQWPTTYCNIRQRYRQSQCTLPIPRAFKIHGLWPMNNNGIPPPPPCSNVAMVAKATVYRWPFINDLLHFWPNLAGDNYSFWSYEWTNHGTCSGLSPRDYFSTTIQKYKDLGVDNLLNTLASKGVRPGNSYNNQFLQAQLTASLGNNKMICFNNNGVQHFWEARVCLNATLHVMACPNTLSGGCGTRNVNFPN